MMRLDGGELVARTFVFAHSPCLVSVCALMLVFSDMCCRTIVLLKAAR